MGRHVDCWGFHPQLRWPAAPLRQLSPRLRSRSPSSATASVGSAESESRSERFSFVCRQKSDRAVFLLAGRPRTAACATTALQSRLRRLRSFARPDLQARDGKHLSIQTYYESSRREMAMEIFIAALCGLSTRRM
jgi:hypothetical protein